MRLRLTYLLAACWLLGFAPACTSTVPTARSIDALRAQVRDQEKARYDELDQQRAAGALNETAYQQRKADLDQYVTQRVNDIAWTRHFLDQSERKANGLPTPDLQPTNIAPNPMQGGAGTVGAVGNAGGAGSFYRPFTQQGQGAMNNNAALGGAMLPRF